MLHASLPAITFGLAFGAGVVLDEKSLIPIGTACAIAGIIFWLGRKLQRIDDTFTNLQEKIEDLPCKRDAPSPKKEVPYCKD